MDVRVEKLSFSYRKGQKILEDLSFVAPSGQITAIVGANGAGKTTLVKSIIGLLNPEGNVYLGEHNRKELSFASLAEKIGYLTQESTVQASLSVFEVIMLGRLHHLGMKVDQAEIDHVWNLMGILKIQDLADQNYSELSGGQRRIVNIAQTIVKDPEVLILDEPTANLDLQNEFEMLELIRNYTDQKKTATIVILHDLTMACRYADHIVILKDGKVFREGKPSEVINEEVVKEAYGVNARLVTTEDHSPLLYVLNSVRETEYHFGD